MIRASTRFSIIVAGTVFLVTILTACTGSTSSQAMPLEGTNWLLQSYRNPSGQEQNVLESTVVTALFNEGNLVGNDGCNNYSARYTISGSNITIQPGVSTMMACEQPVMDQATAYQAALASAASFKIKGDSLEISDKDGKAILTYKAGTNELGGTSWKALAYNNGKGGVVSLTANSEITADFSTDGKLSGSAGCNTYNAEYKTEGNAIEIGPAATTRMFCDGLMDQETAYLAALDNAATFLIQGKQLTLRDAGGATMVQYEMK